VCVVSRVVVVVLDGVGAGELPDAAAYGDAGADTLVHVLTAAAPELPHLASLGLGAVTGLPMRAPRADATFGRLVERGAGKDTTAGHWELMGLEVERAFPTYPAGFPDEIIVPFEDAIGRRVLANRPASGTEIIAELGAEHLATGRPIVYTSADSVFQVAAHEGIVPVALLYEWCETARRLLVGPHAVGRVIARPFAGEPGAFVRTSRRRDFSLPPTGPTYLDLLSERDVKVIGVGKIGEIFAQRGVSLDDHTTSNGAGLAACRRHLDEVEHGLVFANLVDFDMTWGHRNDVAGFADGLIEVDAALPGLMAALRPEDALLLCADHGVDPTTPGTDHTREHSPLLALGLRPGRHDGFFADVGATAFRLLTGESPSLSGTAIVA
jgi:phosphopentomutase